MWETLKPILDAHQEPIIPATEKVLADMKGDTESVRAQIATELSRVLSEHGLVEGKRIAKLVAARLDDGENKHVVIESSPRLDGGTDIEVFESTYEHMRLARFELNRREGKKHLMWSLREGETELQ